MLSLHLVCLIHTFALSQALPALLLIYSFLDQKTFSLYMLTQVINFPPENSFNNLFFVHSSFLKNLIKYM